MSQANAGAESRPSRIEIRRGARSARPCGVPNSVHIPKNHGFAAGNRVLTPHRVDPVGRLEARAELLRNEGDVIEKLAEVAAQVGAETIVFGIPRRDRPDRRDQMLRELAERLRQKTCKEVVLWDESLSTAVASDRARQTGRSRRDAQRDIDMHAAAVILQSYLDELSRQRRPS